MRVVVASCWNYRDSWKPFFSLFDKFWPDCPYPVELLTDQYEGFDEAPAFYSVTEPRTGWCENITRYAASRKAPILLMQEDFFLNAPVQTHLIEHALHEMKAQQAAMVRLYPCPGSNENYGDTHFGRISKGTAYRVSCQTAIWNPAILHEIASHYSSPAQFEILGTDLSNTFDEPFLAFKREVKPWPLEYYCSAISRGKWEPAALEFCRQQGIEVDTSMRGVT